MPNFARTKFRHGGDKTFRANRFLANLRLLCLVSVLLWYSILCSVSDGGHSLHVILGPMASSRLMFLVCYGCYFIHLMQVVLVGELVRQCIIT